MKRTTEQFRVKGVTYDNRQGYLAYIAKHPDTYVTLRRERNNPHDANAIQVVAHIPSQKKHMTVGYVPKEMAVRLAQVMDNDGRIWTVECPVSGGRGFNYGMTVTIKY